MFSLYHLRTKSNLVNKPIFTKTNLFTSSRSLFFSTQINTIPKMPLLEKVAKAGKSITTFNNTAFFGVQHILKTNVPLFKHLIQDFGANPNYIFLSGKGYSDSETAELLFKQVLGIQYFKLNPSYAIPGEYQSILRSHLRKTWGLFINTIKSKPIERIVVFDEGGHCFETMPESLCFDYPMVGIEQTRGGLYSPTIGTLPFPLVEVASSAVKRHLESPLIATALLKKLKNILNKKNANIHSNTVFGVIGNGAIGSNLTQYLLSQGHKVVAYDENPNSFSGSEWDSKNFYRGKDIQEVIIRSSFIFGCTGKNVIKGRRIVDLIATDKTFISCTSEDKEFQTLLKDIRGSKSTQLQKFLDLEHEDLSFTTKMGGNATILNRGFPVNFDHSGESVPAEEIQLTRGLMLTAFIQGARQAQIIQGNGKINRPPRIMPHPILQQYIARQFKEYQDNDPKLADKYSCFEDLKWIETNSGGENIEDPIWLKHFGDNKNKNESPKLKR